VLAALALVSVKDLQIRCFLTWSVRDLIPRPSSGLPSGVRNLAPLRFHDLRHTYAALMVAASAHPKLLQAQLEHTSINVTLNTYGHLFPDAFVDVGDALDRIVRGAEARAL
jgi:integrase